MFMGSVYIISVDSSKSYIKEIITVTSTNIHVCTYTNHSYFFIWGGGARVDCLILVCSSFFLVIVFFYCENYY